MDPWSSNKGSALGKLLFLLVVLIGLPLTIGFGLYWLWTFPDISALATTNPPYTALIEAKHTEATVQGRPFKATLIWVPLKRISPHLQRAVIVAEDASFYSHHGFDWEGIKEALTRNWEKGKLQRGGSTITQQLAKNLYLTQHKTFFRKAHEALITRALERHLTKKRILELYLNIVEWGKGIYGAEAAARHHFGKSAEALTPEEAALLAAILPAPRRHDPLRLTPYLAKRQRQILKQMGE
jgi:monofunctional biosynthetic peptidoglycan transglycosylase